MNESHGTTRARYAAFITMQKQIQHKMCSFWDPANSRQPIRFIRHILCLDSRSNIPDSMRCVPSAYFTLHVGGRWVPLLIISICYWVDIVNIWGEIDMRR